MVPIMTCHGASWSRLDTGPLGADCSTDSLTTVVTQNLIISQAVRRVWGEIRVGTSQVPCYRLSSAGTGSVRPVVRGGLLGGRACGVCVCVCVCVCV